MINIKTVFQKRELLKEYRGRVLEIQRDKALLAAIALRNATPVKTGRARDGWKFTDEQLVNDVPYIDQLNRGHSRQAPPFFIEKTLLQLGLVPRGTMVTSKARP